MNKFKEALKKIEKALLRFSLYDTLRQHGKEQYYDFLQSWYYLD